MADKAHPHEGGHGGATRYFLSFGALAILTVLTYALHHVDLGDMALGVAMIIAVAKAMVVILFFMHLWDHPGVNRLILAVTILFLGFGITMVFADTFTRFPLETPHFTLHYE